MAANRVLSYIAYGVFACAAAATALAFAMLHSWESPVIPGAAPGYRYVALGYRRPTGEDFTGILSTAVVGLRPLLPPGFGLGTDFGWGHIDVGSRPNGTFSKLHVEFVVGEFLQALHVRPLAGRLISLDDQRRGAAVALLSEAEARRLFGHIREAIGRSIFTRQGFELSVIGVLPKAFRSGEGVMGRGRTNVWTPYTLLMPLNLGHWPKGLPVADMIKSVPFMGPAPLLSVPDSVSEAQLTVALGRLLRNGRGRGIPADVSGFVTTQPYSEFPSMQRTRQRRIRLSLALAAATFGIAAVNLLVLGWLAWLRHRPALRIERVLGARRGYFLKRFVFGSARAVLVMLALCAALIASAMAVLKHFLGTEYASILDLQSLWPTLVWILPLLVLVVVMARALPLAVLLARESLLAERMALTHSDRWAGTALIGLEVLLAALLSVTASWSIAHAWQSRHADLGFLDRPATVVATQRAGFFWMGNALPDRAAFDLAMDRVLAAAHSVAPDVSVGFGPDITRQSEGHFFPKAVTAGKRVTSACPVGATTGWLQATGARVLAGQAFQPGKVENDAVLIDARVARALFGSPRAAVGGSIFFPHQSADRAMRITGVLAPLSLRGADQPACPLVVEDMRADTDELTNPATLAIGRTLDAGERALLRSRLRAAFAQAGLKLKVVSVRSTGEERAWLARRQTEQARVFAVIALFAWIVALSGVFAQMRLYLAMRKRLAAIHAALGAGPRHLYRRVMAAALALTLVGMALAMLVIPWLARQFAFLSGAEVFPYHAATWIALAALVLAVAAVAHGPARRAALAEPAESLHEL